MACRSTAPHSTRDLKRFGDSRTVRKLERGGEGKWLGKRGEKLGNMEEEVTSVPTGHNKREGMSPVGLEGDGEARGGVRRLLEDRRRALPPQVCDASEAPLQTLSQRRSVTPMRDK